MGSVGDAGYIIIAFAFIAFALDSKGKGKMDLGEGGKFEGPIWGILFMFGVLLIGIDHGFWWL